MVKNPVSGSSGGKADSWKNGDRCGRRNGRLMGQERSKSEQTSGGLHHILSARLWVYRFELAQVDLVLGKDRFVPSIARPGITITHGISSQIALLLVMAGVSGETK